ncbi:MAG: NosD domain-containing protein, partial [Fervidobacterium sp.]
YPTGFWGDWVYPNMCRFPFTCEIYANESAWQYEPGPEPDTYWERGILQCFNPDSSQIKTVIEQWLPVFTYLANRSILEAARVKNMNTFLGYMTIQDAIDAPETLNGHTIVVSAGTYYEHVTVNKAVSIVGENPATTIIDGGGYGTVVNITVDGVNITGFTVRNSGVELDYAGICLDHVNNCSIIRNYITENNNIGINLYYSNNTTVSENNITSNSWYGVFFGHSYNNTLSGNIFVSDGLTISNSYGNNIVDNLVNGKPLIYLENASDITISDAGQIILINCDRIKVENIDLSNTDGGIQLSNTNNTTIAKNNITNNTFGVDLGDSCNNSISENNIMNNEFCGLLLYASAYNTFSANIIASNNIGVYLYNSSGNTFYHNNFIDNVEHVYVYRHRASYNIWDDGYPSGGNYWSDYIGVDLYYGPYQNETGSDGVSDLPYGIDVNNVDRYPLMSKWPSHDLAIINIVSSHSIVNQGDSLTLNVTIINKGDFTEAFNLTVYANTTVIGIETITDLPIRIAATFSFTWNTTGFVTGNYTISANATTVEGETHTDDNTCTDGTVTVKGEIHDVAIVNVTFSKQTPSVNETIFIYVTVENRGTFTETFDASVNYTLLFDPLIGTQTITLEPEESIILNFTWAPNATGRYEIKAYASEIPDDVNPSDNTKITYLYVSATYTSTFSAEENDWADMNVRRGRYPYMAFSL